MTSISEAVRRVARQRSRTGAGQLCGLASVDEPHALVGAGPRLVQLSSAAGAAGEILVRRITAGQRFVPQLPTHIWRKRWTVE
ncbi:hypothetical protein SGPA1_50889 [Streptomyces misionensis JCM 4497]